MLMIALSYVKYGDRKLVLNRCDFLVRASG